MVYIIQLVYNMLIIKLGQENGVSFSNIVKLNGESYDLRTNYQSKITDVFQESSK